MLRPPGEVVDLLDNIEANANCYHDPAFDDERSWCLFVKEMLDAGLLRFGLKPKVVGARPLSVRNRRQKCQSGCA